MDSKLQQNITIKCLVKSLMVSNILRQVMSVIFNVFKYVKASHGAGIQVCDRKCYTTRLGLIPTQENIYYFHFFTLELRQRRSFLPLNTQCLQNSAGIKKQCLNTRSPCLQCFVQDTGWSWKKNHTLVSNQIINLVVWQLLYY